MTAKWKTMAALAMTIDWGCWSWSPSASVLLPITIGAIGEERLNCLCGQCARNCATISATLPLSCHWLLICLLKEGNFHYSAPIERWFAAWSSFHSHVHFEEKWSLCTLLEKTFCKVNCVGDLCALRLSASMIIRWFGGFLKTEALSLPANYLIYRFRWDCYKLTTFTF